MIENRNHVYSAMRSLFRFHQMKEMNAPDIIVDTEKKLLETRISELSADDIYFLMTNWPQFYSKRIIEDEIQNRQCEIDLERMVLDCN